MTFLARLPIRYAKLVLVWFVLTIGVSVAAPVVAPKLTSFACTTMGMKVIEDGKDVTNTASSSIDCPFCVNFITPVSGFNLETQQVSPLAHALKPVEAAHIASATAPPLPSRGPPSTSC